jgi:peptidoglycan hydrolase CwlO-like protein
VPSNFNVLEAVLDWFKSHSGIATKHDLKESEHKIMSVLSDLQDSVTALQTASANENSAVLAAIADIQSLPASDAALVPLTSAISAVAKSTQANADSLNAAIAAPAPAPAPAPAA